MIDLLARVDQTGRIRWKRAAGQQSVQRPPKGRIFCPRKTDPPSVALFMARPSAAHLWLPRLRLEWIVAVFCSFAVLSVISVSKMVARGGNLILRKFSKTVVAVANFSKPFCPSRFMRFASNEADFSQSQSKRADKQAKDGDHRMQNCSQQTKLAPEGSLIKRSRDFIILLLIAQIYHRDR